MKSEKAKADFDRLQRIVAEYDGTLSNLCAKLHGHNLNEDDHLFDVNFGTILGTVKAENGRFRLLTYGIEVYDKEGGFMGCFSYAEIVNGLMTTTSG